MPMSAVVRKNMPDCVPPTIKSTFAYELCICTSLLQVRDYIVPTNRRYPLDMLLGVLREAYPYGKRRGDNFVVIEYVLLRGVNDT